MTGFFTKGLFRIPGEMLDFKSCLARRAKWIIAKQRTYPKCTIETIRDSNCSWRISELNLSFGFDGHFCLCPELDITYLRSCIQVAGRISTTRTQTGVHYDIISEHKLSIWIQNSNTQEHNQYSCLRPHSTIIIIITFRYTPSNYVRNHIQGPHPIMILRNTQRNFNQ